MHHLMNEIRALGLAWCKDFKQAGPRNVSDKQLYDLIKNRRLLYNPDSYMIDHGAVKQHLQNASRQQSAKEDIKMRIVKTDEQSKIDLTITLSMGTAECLRLDM